MDASARAELIRARYYAQHPRRPRAEPKARKPRYKSGGWMSWGTNFDPFGAVAPGQDAGWVETPDPKAPVTVRTARTTRKHALTRIAEQLPAKLPVVPLPR